MEYIKNNELEYFNYSEFKNIIPFDYVILNAQGLIIEANEEISNIFGITKQYLLKQPLARYIPPDYQVRYKQFFQNLLGIIIL